MGSSVSFNNDTASYYVHNSTATIYVSHFLLAFSFHVKSFKSCIDMNNIANNENACKKLDST